MVQNPKFTNVNGNSSFRVSMKVVRILMTVDDSLKPQAEAVASEVDEVGAR